MWIIAAMARSVPIALLASFLLAAFAIWVGIAFKLTIAGSIGLYFVVWWTVLFVILPVRVRSQTEAGTVVAGSEPGAPASPALCERAIWTTIVSDVIFVLVAIFFPLAGL